jgi:hypothetical protein
LLSPEIWVFTLPGGSIVVYVKLTAELAGKVRASEHRKAAPTDLGGKNLANLLMSISSFANNVNRLQWSGGGLSGCSVVDVIRGCEDQDGRWGQEPSNNTR